MYFNRTYFDAAKPTLASAQFDGTGDTPFENLSSPERKAARERARWLQANSGLIYNIDESIVNNSVGANGMKLRMMTDNEDFNQEIEYLYEWFLDEGIDYYGEKSGADMQRSLLFQRMVDGGVFERFAAPIDNRWPFSIQLVEVDNLYDSKMYSMPTGIFKDGIIMSRTGKVTAYAFQKHKHLITGEYLSGKAVTPKIVRNDDNIIFFKRYDTPRASQKREFTEYARIVTDMKFFMSFQQSTVEAASARSKLTFAIEQSAAPRPGLVDDSGNKYEYINGVYAKYLKPGEKIHEIDPAAAGTKYEEFTEYTVRFIAIGRGISYELAMRDAKRANFSAMRGALIQDHKLFDYNQMNIVGYHCNPVLNKFIRMMAMSGRLSTVTASEYLSDERAYHKHMWIGPARPWVDPLKDIMALVKKYELGVISLGDIAKSEGKDIADIIADRARENEMMQRAGILTLETQ